MKVYEAFHYNFCRNCYISGRVFFSHLYGNWLKFFVCSLIFFTLLPLPFKIENPSESLFNDRLEKGLWYILHGVKRIAL